MELQALRTFLAVVDKGSIQAAANDLHTVQSNVTARIKRLEAELETPLFYRRARQLKLAPSGEVLVEYGRQLLALESRATQAVRSVGLSAGQLRLGAMETFAGFKLPKLLELLRNDYPQLSLQVTAGHSQELIELVLEQRLDGAFVGGPVDHPQLEVVHYHTERLVLVSAHNSSQSNLPMLVFKEGCAYRARALAWQQQQGRQADGNMSFASLEGILGCVASGLGICLMPAWVVESSLYRQQLVTIELDSPLAQVPTQWITHKQGEKLPVLKGIEHWCQSAS